MAKIKTIVQVQGSGTFDTDTVVLGETFVRRLKVPTGQSITLKFGALRHGVRLASASQSAAIRLSEPLATRLGVQHGAQLALQYKSGSRSLTAGPVIGVLMSRASSDPDRPFGDSTAFCRELTDACHQAGGLVYFFTPDGIGSGGTVSGWTYAGRWRRGTYPTPDIVYNRLTTRKLENKPSVQHFFREVKSRYGGHVFNERYLDKTEVFQSLRGDPALSRVLPESHAFTGVEQLKSMLTRHQNVYLKPITGSLGNGIIHVVRENAGVACHFSAVNGTVRRVYPSLAKAYSAISARVRGRKYQIQQGIRLITVGGRPLDFRALVQRNGQGVWTVTSIVGRIAGSNQFVSNVARGGSMMPARQALQKSSLTAGTQRTAQLGLRKAALDIAKGIENRVKGHFAELGIDLAVDSGGRVWLIEVNSKPSKNDNTQLSENKIRPSVKMMVQYAHHLAGF